MQGREWGGAGGGAGQVGGGGGNVFEAIPEQCLAWQVFCATSQLL